MKGLSPSNDAHCLAFSLLHPFVHLHLCVYYFISIIVLEKHRVYLYLQGYRSVIHQVYTTHSPHRSLLKNPCFFL